MPKAGKDVKFQTSDTKDANMSVVPFISQQTEDSAILDDSVVELANVPQQLFDKGKNQLEIENFQPPCEHAIDRSASVDQREYRKRDGSVYSGKMTKKPDARFLYVSHGYGKQ